MQVEAGFCSYLGEGLKELSLKFFNRSFPLADYTPAIASLRSLTRLELGSCYDWTNKDLQSLRQLDIIELAIRRCDDLHTALLVPGSLQSLQRLSIEADLDLRATRQPAQPQPGSTWHQELLQAWANVLALPCLRQLSGFCHLFNVGKEQSRVFWQEKYTCLT